MLGMIGISIASAVFANHSEIIAWYNNQAVTLPAVSSVIFLSLNFYSIDQTRMQISFLFSFWTKKPSLLINSKIRH